jgi:hypothetical protein
MKSKAEIQSVVDSFVGNVSPSRKCDVCHHGARIVEDELTDMGFNPTLHISSISAHGLQNGHIFVTIDGNKVEDIDSDIVVVDAYLEQFCDEVMEQKEKKISLGPAESIPSILVIGRDSEWFEYYDLDT